MKMGEFPHSTSAPARWADSHAAAAPGKVGDSRGSGVPGKVGGFPHAPAPGKVGGFHGTGARQDGRIPTAAARRQGGPIPGHCCKVSDEAAFCLIQGLTFQNSAYWRISPGDHHNKMLRSAFA